MRYGLPLIVAMLACACSPKPRVAGPGSSPLHRFDYDFPAFGTRFHVTFFAADPQTATAAAGAVTARIEDLESKLSADRADGELARLCAGAGGPARKLSDDLFDVLEMGQRVARRSGGAFDVTAGPYVSLWRRAEGAGAAPSDEQLEVVRPLVGWGKLRLDSIERTASLEKTGMRLDPGLLTLGYVADRVLGELKAQKVDRAYVETEPGPFGRVRVFGSPPPGQAGWGLEVLRGDGRRFAGPVPTVANAALASGAAGGVVNPLTGKWQRSDAVAVVLGRSGATAAALASAAAVLGPGRGEEVVKAAGAAVRFEPASRRQ